MKYRFILLILVILLLTGYVFFAYVKLPYSIKSKGIIYPLREWRIEKNDNGSLLNVLKNYSNNTISYYSVTEFQRGDFAEFVVNESVYNNDRIAKGDTIGILQSNEEKRRYLSLLGNLEVKQNLLRVYSTGVKPEEIDVALEELNLARHEHEAQKKIIDRNRILYEEEYLSEEEFERSLNRYKNRLHRVNLAKAEYNALKAGDKQEQIDYIKSDIERIENQIKQIEKRINSFNMLSPFSGKMVKQQTGKELGSALIKLIDDSQLLVVMPVELYQLEYIEIGQKVNIKLNTGYFQSIDAEVVDIDNSIQMIDFRENIFITAAIDMEYEHVKNILPNMIVDLKIYCGRVPAKDYLWRLFRTVYQN